MASTHSSFSSTIASPNHAYDEPRPPTPPRSSPNSMQLNIPAAAAGVNIDITSPRMKVARSLEAMQLNNESPPVSRLALRSKEAATDMSDRANARKRPRSMAGGRRPNMDQREIPETPSSMSRKKFTIRIAAEIANGGKASTDLDPYIFKGGWERIKNGALSGNNTTSNRPEESESRSPKKQRLNSSAPNLLPPNEEHEPEIEIVDPDRAAFAFSLTSTEVSRFFWQDSEITGHNPTDPDDDLEGINGIGFRPTAAIAHQRTEKRKQQLKDYRSREARDARARRTERRRGSEMQEAERNRRVRFEGMDMTGGITSNQ